jgi:hypothetical protein
MVNSKLNDVFSSFEKELDGGLIALDLFSLDDGQSIAGINSNDTASALFADVTSFIQTALKKSFNLELDNYYLLELEGNKAVIVLTIDTSNYGCGMLIDTSKVKVGYLTNIALKELTIALTDVLVTYA